MQNAFDVLTYNDYSGYGTGEVVENMVPIPPYCYYSNYLADGCSCALFIK